MLRKKPSGYDIEIKTSSGVPDIYHTSWIIMGPPGVGKSTLFSGFPDVLFLVTSEKEVKRLKVPYILIDSWGKVESVTRMLIDERHSKFSKYRFIAIDFIDAVWTLCVSAVCEKYGIDHLTDAGYGKGADTADKFFRDWFTRLIASDYGVLVVSHVVNKDIFSVNGTITKQICTLKERARNIVFPLVNVIGCMGYKTVKQVSAKNPDKTALVRRRVIMFEETEYVEAKDRDGVLPKEIVLSDDPRKNFQIFLKYYGGGDERKGGDM